MNPCFDRSQGPNGLKKGTATPASSTSQLIGTDNIVCLRGLLVDGCWIEDPSRVKEEVRQFYMKRFREVEGPDQGWNGSDFRQLTSIKTNIW